jgi:adenylylsulfate kinase-like enzyme
MEAFTLCLTGPSGTWKSALAREIEGALLERGMDVQVMEGEPGAETPGSLAAGMEEKERISGRECAERRREGIVVLVSAPILEAPVDVFHGHVEAVGTKEPERAD